MIEAEKARCRALFPDPVVGLADASARGGPGGCGIAAPLRVSSLADGTVEVRKAATLNCAATAALNTWLRQVVQPAARARLGTQVVAIRNYASYVCRRRYGRSAGRLSHHALGNALDIGIFMFANGEHADVKKHWTWSFAKSRFLHDVHKGACKIFGTVLGPNANKAHENHFHLDIGRGGICE